MRSICQGCVVKGKGQARQSAANVLVGAVTEINHLHNVVYHLLAQTTFLHAAPSVTMRRIMKSTALQVSLKEAALMHVCDLRGGYRYFCILHFL